MVALLFDDELYVHYRQFYVESRDDGIFEEPSLASGGQVNGLCGAAVPGFLFLTTGLHTGNVKLTVELLDAPRRSATSGRTSSRCRSGPSPARCPCCSGRANGLATGSRTDRLPGAVLRACGMGQAQEQDNRFGDDPLLDRYLLQLWPAPEGPDEVLRQTSASAGYWHNHARTLPPPPTPAQRAQAQLREQLAREEAATQARREAEEREWGGRPTFGDQYRYLECE